MKYAPWETAWRSRLQNYDAPRGRLHPCSEGCSGPQPGPGERAVRDTPSPEASALEDYHLSSYEPRAVWGICGQEAQHTAGHSDMPKSTWAQANMRPAGQTLQVGLRDTQVFLTQMECGVSTFPKGDRGHLVFLCTPRSYRGVPEWLSVPPPALWSLPTPSLQSHCE